MGLVILGAGGLAREVLQSVKDIYATGKFEGICPLGFIDEDESNHGKIIHGLSVLGGFDWLLKASPQLNLAMGVGFPRIRKKFVDNLENLGLRFRFPALIHPTAHIGGNVKFGHGAQVMMHNSITVDITVGNYVLINQGCSIGHDTVIEDFACLSPHCVISGHSHICEGADLGSNVITKPGVKVGAWSVVGLQSGVVKDIPEKVVAVGCPAKPIKDLA